MPTAHDAGWRSLGFVVLRFFGLLIDAAQQAFAQTLQGRRQSLWM